MNIHNLTPYSNYEEERLRSAEFAERFCKLKELMAETPEALVKVKIENEKAMMSAFEIRESIISQRLQVVRLFDIIRSKMENVNSDSRDHAYLFALCMNTIEMPQEDIMEAYAMYRALDTQYKKSTRFASLNTQHQEQVLRMLLKHDSINKYFE